MDTTEVNELYDAAERRRRLANGDRGYAAAIKLYRRYIAGGGENAQAARHMAGVCYEQMGRHQDALEYLGAALVGASALDQGNINRDMAKSYAGLERFTEADDCLSQALAQLPMGQYPEEHGATVGFRARLYLQQGDRMGAIREFARADEILQAGDDRRLELYNKLAYAVALSRAGRRQRSRSTARQSLGLAFSKDPTGERHGGWVHVFRALLILTSGHHAEDLWKALRRRRRNAT